MLSFRRPKSKKDKKLRKRKGKMLKADDLIPDESALADDTERSVLKKFSIIISVQYVISIVVCNDPRLNKVNFFFF